MLVETRPRWEKFVYDWRLDRSRVADVTAGRTIVARLPPRTAVVTMDPAYDAYDVYELVERQGADPVIKPRRNARIRTVDARGRALRWRARHPAAWRKKYNRRPITESVNYAIKRRFGDRLWSKGLRSQRKEMARRIIVYNVALLCRWTLRMGIHRGR